MLSMLRASARQLASARKARFHVQAQVSFDPVRLPPVFTPCRGIVLRVFRGAEELRPGDQVAFRLPLLDGRPPPADGVSWFQAEQILNRPVVEVFLDGTPTELKLVGDGHFCSPLVAPTDQPVRPSPSAEDVHAAWANEHGESRTLFLRQAQVTSVVGTLAALGATLESAVPNRQNWTLGVTSGEPVRLSLVEEFLEEIRDPEVAMYTVLRQLESPLERLGCEPHVALDMHWRPDQEAVAQRLIRDLLAAHPGVVHDWMAHLYE